MGTNEKPYPRPRDRVYLPSRGDDRSNGGLVKLARLFALRARWAPVVLLVVVLAVYLLTLLPGAAGGDAGEMQFVPHILSLPHPTGTPLYCLLGSIWSRLPLGPSVAWRMNLLAALSAALAVVAVYYTVYTGAGRILPAWVAAGSLAFGLVFWEQALLADKYAFNALMVAGVLALALRWGQARAPRTLNLLALAYGLSLAHRTMALFAPALLGYVWWYERGALWRDRRRLLRLAALCLAPLLLYLYLPWASSRGLPPGTWQPRTWRQWYAYLLDTGFTGQVHVDPADLGERLSFYARTLLRDFGWVGVALGCAGLVWMGVRRRAEGAFLLASFGLQAFLAANHHVPRHWVYFIPSFLIFSLWIGEGTAGVVQALERFGERLGWARPLPSIALYLALLAWLALPFPARYRPLRASHLGAGVLDPWRQTLKTGRMGDRMGRALAGVDAQSAILCDWEQSTALWYYQQVEGLRPDVQIVYPIDRLQEAAARGLPLYVARAYEGVGAPWHPFATGPLIALRPEPTYALPAGASPHEVRFGDRFDLAGSAYGEARFRPGTVVPLTLYWRALQAPAHDYSVSLRLLDAAGQVRYQVDSQHPVLGTYPTSRWSAGEVVGDYYEIQLPPDLSPGTYRWGVILYRGLPEGGWESLEVSDGGGEVAIGGTLEVVAR